VAATLAARLSPRAPAPLVGVVTAIVVARLFGFHEREIGATPGTLAAVRGFSWSPRDVLSVLPSAFGLAFVSSVNILITSRVVEHFRAHARAKASDADAELGAYGIANLCAGMFGAPLSVGIPARSLAVVRCAAPRKWRTCFMPRCWPRFCGWVPARCRTSAAGSRRGHGMDGAVSVGLGDVAAAAEMSRVDATAFLATAISVLAVNAVMAVAIGCSVYALKFVYPRWVKPESGVPEVGQASWPVLKKLVEHLLGGGTGDQRVPRLSYRGELYIQRRLFFCTALLAVASWAQSYYGAFAVPSSTVPASRSATPR